MPKTLPLRRRHGLTLLEMLLAVTITLAFLGGAILSYMQIIRASEQADSRLEAFHNARHALDTLAIELRAARMGPVDASPRDLFLALTEPLGYGNGTDEDQDQQIDEETFDGTDDDEDWVDGDDRHSRLSENPPLYERQAFVGLPDLGDSHVDEDVQYSSTTLTFRSFPNEFGPSAGMRQVRFYVGTYDEEPNVLIQEVTTISAIDGTTTTLSGPLAFNVLSFGALYWGEVEKGSRYYYWCPSWNSADRNPSDGPRLPASVYLTLTLYAGRKQEALTLPPSGPMETVTLNTTVNIESVLSDPNYKTAVAASFGQPATKNLRAALKRKAADSARLRPRTAAKKAGK